MFDVTHDRITWDRDPLICTDDLKGLGKEVDVSTIDQLWCRMNMFMDYSNEFQLRICVEEGEKERRSGVQRVLKGEK